MERASNLKMPFLLALLVIGSCLNGKTEADVVCKGVSDCAKICAPHCSAIGCKKGHCQCACDNAVLGQGVFEDQRQCNIPGDCAKICGPHCHTIGCKKSRCECACDKVILAQDVFEDQRQCNVPGDCVKRCHGCTVNKCTAGLCVCGC